MIEDAAGRNRMMFWCLLAVAIFLSVFTIAWVAFHG